MAKKRKKQQEPGTRKLKWGIAVALLLAFLVGGVVGAVVERERVLNAREEDLAASTETPTDWFTTSDASMCPPLQRWSTSAAAAYLALAQGTTDWSTSRATQLRQSSEATASLQSLLPVATAKGKAGIQGLIVHEAKVREALLKATSAAEYSAARRELDSDRTMHDLGILAQTMPFCPTS